MENLNDSPFIDDFSIKNEEKVKAGENLTTKNSILLAQQAEKSVCEIIKDNGYGSGFFCTIKYESEEMCCLFTNNHAITEDHPEKNAEEDGKPLITADQIPVENTEMYLFKLMFLNIKNAIETKKNKAKIRF